MAYLYLRSKVDQFREAVAPLRHTSNFRETGQLTPEEFQLAGDYLVYKFPSWSWSDAASPSKRVAHFPEGKQFLVTRGVPCRRRLGGNNATADVTGDAELRDVMIKGEDGEEDWLSAGDFIKPGANSGEDRLKEVKSLEDSDKLGDVVGDDEDIPDMEDYEEDDDAIIRDKPQLDDSFRTYNLYIMYSQYYRTPRLYLSGYTPTGGPLPPERMMDDIVGDYTDKTVTLEPFPFVDSGLRMASIHPCRHAAVMKLMLDRADAALKFRVSKLKEQGKSSKEGELVSGFEGLEISKPNRTGTTSSGDKASGGEEWEVLDETPEGDENEVAIRVDQYLVVFLKFMASVTPGIEHDFTMGV